MAEIIEPTIQDEEVVQSTKNITADVPVDMSQIASPTPSQSIIAPGGLQGMISSASPTPSQSLIIETTREAADQAVSEKAAETTIGSGLSPEGAQQAATQIKEDIKADKKSPGFFEGVMSGIGNFIQSDQGRLLVAGLAGKAVSGGELGGANAFVVGGAGGMDQLGLEKQQRLEQAKLKAQEEQQGFDNKLALERLGISKKQIEINRKKLDIDKINKKLEKSDTVAKGEDVLRKEFNPIQKKFNEVKAANNKLKEGLTRETAAGDLAGIFAYMKVLDPGSTVREGEFANAQNSAGIPDRMRAAYNNAINGKRLGPDQRRDFLDTSAALFEQEQKIFSGERKRFADIAGRREFNINNVVGAAEEAVKKEQKPTTETTTTEKTEATINPDSIQVDSVITKNGKQFKFTGGDPTKGINWEALS